MQRDTFRYQIQSHKMLARLYGWLYPILLPRRYKKYRLKALRSWCSFHPTTPATPEILEDMCHETIVYGTFFEEYLLYNFDRLDFEGRRTYLTDSVRNALCNKINDVRMQDLLADKFRASQAFQPFFHRDTILVQSAADRDKFLTFAAEKGEVVVKPLHECAGRGIRLLKGGSHDCWESFFVELLCMNSGFIVEERIRQDERMAKWHSASVNTIRANTILRNGHYTLFNCFIRTGRGSNFVDNGAQGGLFASISPNNGTIITPGCDENGIVYYQHPDSGIVFQGARIPLWHQLCQMAEQLARNIPQLVYVGWDLALTPDGWVMIEGNKGQFVAQQLTLQRGLRYEFENLIR